MTELPQLGLYRRATAAALVLAPAVFLLDNLLHPKEYERDNEARQLAEIAQNYDRWQLAHALGFLAIIGFAAAVLGLAFVVRRRRPRLGLCGGALGIAGLLSLAAVVAIDGYTWGVLGDVWNDRNVAPTTAETALHQVQQSGWSLVYYLPTLAFVAGLVSLAVGVTSQGAAPAWAGALLALGAVMVGLETSIVSNAYFIASAVVLLAGGAAVAAAIARMSDAEFARGGPAGTA